MEETLSGVYGVNWQVETSTIFNDFRGMNENGNTKKPMIIMYQFCFCINNVCINFVTYKFCYHINNVCINFVTVNILLCIKFCYCINFVPYKFCYV